MKTTPEKYELLLTLWNLKRDVEMMTTNDKPPTTNQMLELVNKIEDIREKILTEYTIEKDSH